MDVVVRLHELLEKYGWSEYRLAREAGLSQTTIANLFKRNNLPTLPTLEAICKAFDMTLAQFFMEDEFVELTPRRKTCCENGAPLTLSRNISCKNF